MPPSYSDEEAYGNDSSDGDSRDCEGEGEGRKCEGERAGGWVDGACNRESERTRLAT